MQDGKRHGEGTYTYSTMMGGVYTGQWRNGMRDGWGKLVKNDGEMYQVLFIFFDNNNYYLFANSFLSLFMSNVFIYVGRLEVQLSVRRSVDEEGRHGDRKVLAPLSTGTPELATDHNLLISFTTTMLSENACKDTK